MVEQIKQMFLKNVGYEIKADEEEKPFQEVQGWDSLKHVQFILDIETCFNIQLDSDELEEANTITKLYNIINSR
jgi:acyl carrier protein